MVKFSINQTPNLSIFRRQTNDDHKFVHNLIRGGGIGAIECKKHYFVHNRIRGGVNYAMPKST